MRLTMNFSLARVAVVALVALATRAREKFMVRRIPHLRASLGAAKAGDSSSYRVVAPTDQLLLTVLRITMSRIRRVVARSKPRIRFAVRQAPAFARKARNRGQGPRQDPQSTWRQAPISRGVSVG